MTDNHLYWSVDRSEFVPAGNLRIGETRNTSRGTTTVARIERVTNDAPVYNLEVNNEHVYRVGELGTLVHNAYALHHLFARALGSDIAYGSSDLTRLGISAHRKLHKALNKHLKKYTTMDSAGNVVGMMPRRGNPGSMVRRNFTSDERKNAVQDFYEGYKDGKYLQDFLTELTKNNVR